MRSDIRHVVAIGDPTEILPRLDFDEYAVSLIVHRQGARFIDPELRGRLATVETIDIPLLASMTEYHAALDQIVACADRLSSRVGPIDRVVGIHEDTVLPAAELRARFDLPGHRPALILPMRDKLLMKRKLSVSNTVRYPKFVGVEGDRKAVPKAFDSADYPLVVKPRAEAGSRGVHMVASAQELEAVLARAEPEAELEVEQFIDAPQFTSDGLVRDGDLVFLNTYEMLGTNWRYHYERSYMAGVVIDETLAGASVANVERTLRAFDYRDGVFHLETFHVGDGVFVFLEIAPRRGGGFHAKIAHDLWGVDLIAEAIRVDLGQAAKTGRCGLVDRTAPIPAGAWLFVPTQIAQRSRVSGLVGMQAAPRTLYHAEVPQLAAEMYSHPASGTVENSARFCFRGTDRVAVLSDVRDFGARFQILCEIPEAWPA